LVVHEAPSRFAARLIQHLLGGINAHDTGAESIRQAVGESLGPTAQVENRADRPAANVRLDDAHPQIENLRAMIASAIVTGWNIGLA
jgi:hypothetical protein